MASHAVKRTRKALAITTALILTGASLAGCVYYPSSYAYGQPGYYAPGYYAPTVVVGGGWGWWGGRRWR